MVSLCVGSVVDADPRVTSPAPSKTATSFSAQRGGRLQIGTVADFKPESWPLQIGTVAGFKSEKASAFVWDLHGKRRLPFTGGPALKIVSTSPPDGHPIFHRGSLLPSNPAIGQLLPTYDIRPQVVEHPVAFVGVDHEYKMPDIGRSNRRG
jgi:hypothetical protein